MYVVLNKRKLIRKENIKDSFFCGEKKIIKFHFLWEKENNGDTLTN